VEEIEMLARKHVGAAALCALATSSALLAATVTRFSVDIDDTFFAPGTSAFCGFAVFRTDKGTVNVSLYYANDGTLRREDDSAVNLTTTWFSPTTGKSVTYGAPATLHTEYPEGAFIGAPAKLRLTGLQSKLPGLPAQAGLQSGTGVVIDIDSGGIPVTDFTVDATSGNFDGLSAVRTAICAALAAP
jgi:hypothetical protein